MCSSDLFPSHDKARKLEAGEQEIQSEFQKMGAELNAQKNENEELRKMILDLKATVDAKPSKPVKGKKKAGVQTEDPVGLIE